MTYEKIMAELQTCQPGERRELINILAARADDPRPAKTLTAIEQKTIEVLRGEIIACKDAIADEAMIAANVAAIRRIRGW